MRLLRPSPPIPFTDVSDHFVLSKHLDPTLVVPLSAVGHLSQLAHPENESDFVVVVGLLRVPFRSFRTTFCCVLRVLTGQRGSTGVHFSAESPTHRHSSFFSSSSSCCGARHTFPHSPLKQASIPSRAVNHKRPGVPAVSCADKSFPKSAPRGPTHATSPRLNPLPRQTAGRSGSIDRTNPGLCHLL